MKILVMKICVSMHMSTGIQQHIVVATDNLRKAAKGINALEQSLSSAVKTMELMKTTMTIWESLSKKHHISRGKLGELRVTWGKEQALMSSFAVDYPIALQDERFVQTKKSIISITI